MSCKMRYVITPVVLLWILIPILEANSTFIPDSTFKGSTLAGWRVLGQADWKAEHGELIGTPRQAAGGWLVLDHSYQDVALYSVFKCTGGCKTGVLLRAEKTAGGGMKGVLVSIAGGEVGLYRVVLDAQGNETQREQLRYAGGWVRVMPPVDPNAPVRGGRGNGRSARGGAPGGFQGAGRGPALDLPLKPPDTSMKSGEWNEFEIILDAGILRAYINFGRETGGAADDEFGSYGPVALYIGGEGEVRFKNVAYKDLAIRVTPTEKVSSHFTVQRISDMYYSWSAAAADFNKDGYTDIVAGPYIYYGPDFTKSNEMFTATALKPSTEFPYAHGDFAYDFDGDGWPDVLAAPPNATLFINPKGESRRWQRYQVLQGVQSESTMMRDIDGDDRPDLVYSGGGYVCYATYDPSDPTKPWTQHNVSERGYGTAHGIGAGDINGDGRMDILNLYGWWEQPPKGSKQETWTYHPQAFGWYSRSNPGGIDMFVYDVNGDGLNDVVTVLSAHGFGIGWYEQKRDSSGKISFVEHIISEGYGGKNAGGVAFSEAHGTALGDVDGDGIPDFIVGKRYWTHLDSYLDADPYGPPVLYWYRTVRNPKAPGGAEFVPELIHNRSGAGTDILAADLNKDGLLDIVTSTDRGTFIFWGKRPAAPAKAAAPKSK